MASASSVAGSAPLKLENATCRRGSIVGIHGHDDRLQRTPFATVHRSNDAGCRRRMAHPGPLVLDQRRSAQHAVADIHAQCRLDVHEVRGDPGDERRRSGELRLTLRCSGKRNVESPGDAMHGHGVRSFLLRCGTKPGGMPGALDSQASLAAQSDPRIDRGQTPRTQAPGKLYSGRPTGRARQPHRAPLEGRQYAASPGAENRKSVARGFGWVSRSRA